MKKLIKRIKAFIKRILRKFSSPSPLPQTINAHPPSVAPLPTVSPRWESGLVLVCSQCGQEHSTRTARSASESEDLLNWLKSQLKFDGLWGEFRVVSTGCLGVCPQKGVTVVLVSKANGKSECLIVDPNSDRSTLYSYIKE
ncbi:(2Fe-2S) ferredoxin domain-containing protein [Nostoc sp. TCL26-01]|uniref:(2Fe-2S) ferredoxin domain-containing protein n=1 Tax=Nostoc sp. TCL26-01 TaxID=2576904 RepID=UPI0015C0AC83|nr:(2Fe-2S) ferredoxin domain-containing protein [Nostoc sp. TCL26-01]QLE55107.1 (2Fe-2S) ferredoxin domain-containing protein [Nostoc sp. TCL26-01]